MSPARLLHSPSQTIGPFFHFALTRDAFLGRMARPAARGERIRVRFRVLDGDGAPVTDAMVELWQADAAGHYPHPDEAAGPDPAFSGFGRLPTDAAGICAFDTIRPGRVRAGDARQAAHINVSIFARGLLDRLCTRLYFEGDPALAEDAVLALVPEDRRRTLIARRVGDEPGLWSLDVRLQGENETVFFDV